MSVRNLWIDQRASVAVEFSLISIFLFIFIFFLVDLVHRQAMVGKLDRVSYSVASVLRERIQLYDRRDRISVEEFEQGRELAKKMLKDMNPDADLSSVITSMQVWYPPSTPGTPQIHFSHGGDCGTGSSFNDAVKLAPEGSYGRKVPVYRFSVCMKSNSWFRRLTAGIKEEPLLSSTSIVMIR
ncbi:hypothetical protein ED28_03100 [[Pantoea] beijingensis]|uniref:Tight adherence protein F n=2 Tax=[Pantoea] beijingensis TaxID=1324864 RepID=A0A443IGW7_9GAMM|nr:hypothetical protein ED28_03100 [[Pantoea] beijingensis]